MFFVVFTFIQALAYILTKIPKTHAPPPAMISSSAVYDKETNTLFSVGGDQIQNNKQISTIFSFNLTTKLWKVISHESDYSPQYLTLHGSYLRSDRKILNFGFFTEVLIFDIETEEWTKVITHGQKMKTLSSIGHTSLYFNGTEYIAIFGGIGEKGYSGDLFLLNVYTFESKKMPNNGKYPLGRMNPSVEYYNESIYIFGYSHEVNNLRNETGTELYRYDLNEEFWEEVEVFGNPPEIRVDHHSAIYKDEMYICFGFLIEKLLEYYDCHKFNFGNRTWIYIKTFDSGLRILGSKVLVDNILYIMYGRDIVNVYNTILAIDFELENLELSVVSEDWQSPPSRVNHCSFVVNQKMFVFAGSNGLSYDSEVLYNDMWAFDFETYKWIFISALGEVPSPRKQFGCSKTTGNVAAIFGGVGENGYLNELYYFHEPQLYWYKATSSNSPPSVRSLSCLAYYNNVLYIIGGKNDKTAFNEIWIYDFTSNKYTQSSMIVKNDNFDSISDAKCCIETYSDTTKLIVLGGNDYYLIPSTYIFEYELFENDKFNLIVKELGQLDSLDHIIGAETSVIITEDYIIRIGGSIYSYILILQFLVYNRKTEEFTILDTSKEFGAWGHTAIHYKDLIYIFGGAGEPGAVSLYKTFISTNYFFELNLTSDVTIKCSKGTEGDGCKPCPKGTYFDKKTCEQCPTGRYNDLLAADSLEQCSPCPERSFNNIKGASFCLQCSNTEICPIGTSTPFKTSELPSNNSIQPPIYESKKDFIGNLVNNLWYAFGGISFITCILCFALNQIYKKFQQIDFFVDRHDFKLEEPIKYRKTSLGGAFSLMFLIACGIIVISGFLNFYYNNFTELRALVPVITLEKEKEIVSKYVALNLTFYIYGGDCVMNNKCNPLIEYLDESFSYLYRKVTCKQVKSNCQVYFEYENLKLTSKNSGIYIKMKEKFSYSSGLSVNITSSSSIPNQISSIITSIKPPSTQTLFRGKTSSVFYYKFTPSIFSSESSEWPEEDTGFHISTDQVVESGSVAPRETLNLELLLLVNILIVESDTAMQTQRIQNQTWFIFGGSLLGSIFGLLGTFGWILSTAEHFTGRIASKIKKKKDLKKYSKIGRKLRSEFNFIKASNKEIKGYPLETNFTILSYK